MNGSTRSKVSVEMEIEKRRAAVLKKQWLTIKTKLKDLCEVVNREIS